MRTTDRAARASTRDRILGIACAPGADTADYTLAAKVQQFALICVRIWISLDTFQGAGVYRPPIPQETGTHEPGLYRLRPGTSGRRLAQQAPHEAAADLCLRPQPR